ncbi:MAG: efflux transporter outer membrane subunit [Phenylobacterium sp.]|uniref:TolC family protein n=1 Tax=Phenylobacterium sp. TaxID=1871053 RepID=UPI0025D48E1F|nr:TolC family protein [Phenylobacterium sp.]MBI1198560.1 efflux transporter outer membrane subunit [Phenylobacterium sp.]
MKRRLHVLTIASALAVTACASGAPPHVDVYSGAQEWGTPTPVAPIDDHWWESFGDARLNALIAEVQMENPRVLRAAARADQAQAQARIAGAARWPQLSAGLGAAKQQQSLAGFPLVDAGGRATSVETHNVGISLNVVWEADLWGRIAALDGAAQEDFLASAENLRAARQSMAAQTAKLYFATIEAREQLEFAQRTVAALEETARQVGDRADAGVASPTDKFLAIANLETARAGLRQRSDAYQQSARQLEVLLGDYPAGQIATPDVLPDAPPPPPAGAPADLLARRPDLIAAEKAVRAAGLRTYAAQRALLPSISLTGSAGRLSSDLSDLLDGDFSVWSIAHQAVQPIFQGGRLRANVVLSDARQREAVEAYAEATLTAFAEVESALAREALLAAREASLATASKAATEAERIAYHRYAQGVAPFLTVLESQQRALDTRSAYIAARRQRLENRIDLHLALGGGFDASNPGAAASPSSE